jgi:peroxiredoxin
MAAAQPPLCDFGWKARDFRLKGIDGKTYTLAEAKGPKGLLVMFICNHCPYVRAIVDRLVRDARDLQKIGVGVVAVMSNDWVAYPDDSFENMKTFAARNGFTFPYVIDETQEVARAWDAVCTPDFFGFNANLELQYRGRLDASRKDPAPADAKRELYEAMAEIARTGRGPKEQNASMGCSIKWKSAA